MINNSIKATKGKHTLQPPLGDFNRKLNVKIWIKNCDNLSVCGLECYHRCCNSHSSSSHRRHYGIYDQDWWKVKTFYQSEAAPSTFPVSKCGANTVVKGSVFVLDITQKDVNSIPPGSRGLLGLNGAPCRPKSNKLELPDLHIPTNSFSPFSFIQFIFSSFHCRASYRDLSISHCSREVSSIDINSLLLSSR